MFSLGAAIVRLTTISSIISFVKQRHHLLISLISLEALILTLALVYVVSGCQLEIFVLFVMFTFGACEARLGLACLVYIVRSFGNDQFKIINSAKC